MKRLGMIFCFNLCTMMLGFAAKSEMAERAPTPPMGWNSWNYFKKGVTAVDAKECIDAIVSSGLKDAGYDTFVIDGGWRAKSINEMGELVPHPIKFPNGIKPLVDYAHQRGLRFGLHTVPGTHDCGKDRVGSYGIEELHIQQFIDWGVDFVKLDKCKLFLDDSCEESEPRYGCWDEEELEATYRKWRAILDEQESEIVLSISAYKFRTWNPEVANMSRTTGDIACRATSQKRAFFGEEERCEDTNKKVFSVLRIADVNNLYADYAGPGYFNDPDMLVTGAAHGLSEDEQRSHFALWCIMTSPLFLGNDPRVMTDIEQSIILNKEAIAINQDNTEQGKKIDFYNNIDVWKKNLSDGSVAILMVNRSLEEEMTYTLCFDQVGIESAQSIYDVFDDFEMNTVENCTEYTLRPHACRFLKIKTN